ncbi:MAG: lamin tail domain-containing protein, partial [bacterium]|nr:lamin tail domain-containing protein [bacterium]
NFALAKPSLWQKVKSFFSGVFGGIADTFADIRKGLEDMLAKLKSKQISQVLTAQMPLYEEESGQSSPSPTANQENLDDFLDDQVEESVGVTDPPLPSPFLTPSPSPSPSPRPSSSPSPSPRPSPSPSPTPSPSPSPLPAKCEKVQGNLPIKNKVILNEIAWMGSINSANDEWIELKNISGGQIDLTDWQILDKNQDIKIIFSKGAKLLFNGFFLLERTDDETVPGKTADLIYTGSLSNTNEALYLFDGNCQLQDEIIANPNWPAGDNSSKRTMEKKGNFGWQTSSNVGGTPKGENSSGYIETPIYTGSGSNPSPSPSPSPPSYSKILISEVQISPITERFIELYNPNNSAVNLTNWYIQRKTQTGSNFISSVSKTYFNSKTINAYSYFLISRSALDEADIVLNDLTLTESNTIQLKNPDGGIVDKVGWGQAQDFETSSAQNPQLGQAIGRKWIEGQSYQDANNNSSDFEIQFPTPKAKNKTFSDIIPPETAIDSKPPNLINQTQAVFTFSSSEGNSTFECKIDEENWQACLSPQQYSSLSDGLHTFQVRAKDISQNTDSTPAQYQWQIDTISPQTEILTHPPFLTNQNQANFIFSSNEGNSTFECDINGSEWENCQSPKTFTDLPDGQYNFSVRAKDPASNIDSSPAQYTWTIDTVIINPSLSLTDLDNNSLLYTNERRVKVTISYDEEAANWLLSESETAAENPDFLWQGERPSEFILSEGDGPKTVYLWTKDESENISPGISAQIILDTTPPLVQFNSLAQIQTSTGFNISWSGSDAISGILEYHLKFREEPETEPESWQTISGQNYQFSGLNGKTYYFKIRAKDNAGNLSEWSSEISTK